MKRCDEYPFVDYANWTDGVGPAIDEDFLKRTQRGLVDLYGALVARSAAIECDDFTGREPGLGQLTTLTNTNGGGSFKIAYVAPAAAGDYGLTQIVATNAAAGSFNAEGGALWLDQADFVWSARLKLTGKANLDLAGNNGFRIGLQNPPDGLALNATFVAGSDKANWQYVIAGSGLTDTGIAASDGTWYELQMARINGSCMAFINGSIVGTVAFAFNLTTLRRKVQIVSGGLAVGDGVSAFDYFKLWVSR